VKFGLSQASWSSSLDLQISEKMVSAGVSQIDIVPSRYDKNLSDEKSFWSYIQQFWRIRGIEIVSVQGFFYGERYSLNPLSLRFSKTIDRYKSAIKVAEHLCAKNLIIGAPTLRASSTIAVKRGFKVLGKISKNSSVRVLIENLPSTSRKATLAKASTLATWISKNSNFFGMCLDIGNLFSWHTTFEEARLELVDVLNKEVVEHIQFNVIEPEKVAWLEKLLAETELFKDYESITIEGGEKDLLTLPKIALNLAKAAN